jgi:hypothetical protein
MSDLYDQSGFNLSGKLLPGERVLHIGYDRDLFQNHVPNFKSIDDLEHYAINEKSVKFNVAFCLEYINFGSKETIETQIAFLISLMRQHGSRIYWRCNPGVQDYVGEQDIYPWSFDEHIRLSKIFGYEVTHMDWDNRQRIYAEWTSNSRTRHYHTT